MRFSTLITAVQIAFGKLNTPATQAMHGETALELTPKLWKYIGWAPRMIELLTQCRRTRRILPLLQVPTQTFQSQEDELVCVRSCNDLKAHSYIQSMLLTGSGHFVYGDEDAAFLRIRLKETLDKI